MALKEEKVLVVENTLEKLNKANGFIVAENRGLVIKDVETLRKNIKAKNGEAKVIKNTLFNIALKKKGVNLNGSKSLLEGPNMFIFSYGDEIELLKEVIRFSKSKEKLVPKGMFLEGRLYEGSQLEEISKLPPKEVLLAIVLGGIVGPIVSLVNVLQAPMRDLLYVLNGIKEKKS
ncbi:MAG TPA: 50S ribosomal protein L10 [bacterium]|jgi:large subunit ribosomal protein L10|nr:50S ribosomal protein L10 [Dictyoglomota bacterium]HHV80144.1 50S ribosomal protein L10 [bacterium]HOK29659.1 50S ribosomal protein L10 [bacterium]HOL54944.1 50S ribosomal protein L10 [bacterium]HOP55736.1 50S ribosomal protein L10 [bacterium]